MDRNRTHTTSRVATTAAALAILAVTSPAWAQPSPANKATSSALFADAQALLTAGRVNEACPKFAEAQRLYPTAGTLLNLGDCFERSTPPRTASAWGAFKQAEVMARNNGDVGRQGEASQRALALEPSLSKITLVVPPPARVQGLELKWDGQSAGEGMWGTAFPVDAGEHSIEAAAPEKTRWTGKVLIRPNGGVVVVEVPALADAPVPQHGSEAPENHPIALTIQGGPVFTPLFGGDVVGSCTGICSMALGIGGTASLYASYRFTTGFVLGLSGGYIAVKEHAASRPSSLLPVGKPPNLGTVDDSLTLRAGLVGVTAGWQFGTRFPVLLRLGAGGAFGAIRDERSGQFLSSKDVAYSVNPLDTHEGMSFVYLAPEGRFGLRIGENVELSVGLEALFLFATAQRVWQPTPWIVGNDGLAKWTTETLTGKTMVFFVPSVALGMSF